MSFNQEALSRANKVMSLLQGQGAIDELGFGRIRDAFSNMMFPGMSTLQSHAKYFLMMPALYAFLERTPIRDARDARAKIREHEISFTYRLLAGTPKEETGGIIGCASLEKRQEYVKYDPAYIYHAGMETYGLIRSGGNIYKMIAERSNMYRNQPKKQRASEEWDGDSEDLNGIRQLFLTCGENYDFKSNAPLSISLTYREATFLKKQIIAHTPGSLIGYLLDSGLDRTAVQYDFDNLENALKDNLPEEIFTTYILARRYSRFAYLLRLRYAMLYNISVKADKAFEDERNFFNWLSMYRNDFFYEAIDEIIRFVSGNVTEESCKVFCRKASKLIIQENWNALDELIVNREVEIKTLKRSKLMNPGDYEPGKPFDTPALMSFRWNTTVKNMLKEIMEGLKK